MKKIIMGIIMIMVFVSGGIITDIGHSTIDGITKDNYMEYEKPNRDIDGYNKGECDREYLEGEEYFYNDDIDHWNVDKVYDEDMAKQYRIEDIVYNAIGDVNDIYIIDSDKEAEWYCIYATTNDKNYVLTIENNEVDISIQVR